MSCLTPLHSIPLLVHADDGLGAVRSDVSERERERQRQRRPEQLPVRVPLVPPRHEARVPLRRREPGLGGGMVQRARLLAAVRRLPRARARRGLQRRPPRQLHGPHGHHQVLQRDRRATPCLRGAQHRATPRTQTAGHGIR